MPHNNLGAKCPEDAANADIAARLARRLARERSARLEAERTAEKGLRDLYAAKRDLDIICKVAATANTANRIDEILEPAVEAVLDATGWPLAAVEQLGARLLEGPPVCLTRSRRDDLASLALLIGRGSLVLQPDSEAADALEKGEVYFSTDLKHDPMPFAQRVVAENCGMRYSVLVPVRTHERTVAVIRLIAPTPANNPQRLAILLGQIADQVARVYERQQMAERLIHDALHDPLTQLANRQLFIDRLNRAAQAKLMGGKDYSVLFLDLDRFKAVNDTMGHAAGDTVLIEVAARINRTVAAYRLLPAPTVARVGGDEFCILVENEPGADGAIGHRLASDLVERIARPFVLGAEQAEIGVSIGVAPSFYAFGNGDLVLKSADTAMYGAKSQGRGQVQIYDQKLRELDIRRERLVQCLREAVKAGFRGFSVVYQPIIDLASERLTGFEALMRFVDDTGAAVRADEFIALAEQHGLIGKLGEFVLDEALQAQARFNASAAPDRKLTISINVSPLQLSPTLAPVISKALTRYEADPALVAIEITENVAIDQSERTMGAIDALRGLGVRVSIDDFGAGYATFGALRKFHFETLKIDRSFVEGLDADEGIRIVKAIIDMGHGLNVAVTAEGIETPQQARMLRELGCDNAQGYYFAHPLDFEGAMREALQQPHVSHRDAA